MNGMQAKPRNQKGGARPVCGTAGLITAARWGSRRRTDQVGRAAAFTYADPFQPYKSPVIAVLSSTNGDENVDGTPVCTSRYGNDAASFAKVIVPFAMFAAVIVVAAIFAPVTFAAPIVGDG